MPTKITERGFFREEALQRSESIKQEHKQVFFHVDDLNEKASLHLSGFPVGLRLARCLDFRGTCQHFLCGWLAIMCNCTIAIDHVIASF
jgi:hypothetical protein